jgi:hypothetical protein
MLPLNYTTTWLQEGRFASKPPWVGTYGMSCLYETLQLKQQFAGGQSRIRKEGSFEVNPVICHPMSSKYTKNHHPYLSPWFPQRLQVQKEEFRYFDRFGQSTDWIPLNLCNKKVENRNIRMVCYFTQYSVTRQLKTETWMLCHFTQYSATRKFISHLAILYGIGGPK